MKAKRLGMILGLGTWFVLTPMWMVSSTFDPARAYKDAIVTPTPTIDEVKVPRSSQNVPFLRPLIDDQSPTQSGVTPLAPSSAGIANGDFENGPDGSWEEYSTHGWDIIVTTSDLPVTPHSGLWAAWLGGDYDDVSYISQTVTIPDVDPVLSFWYYLASDELICAYDFGWVRINLNEVYTIALCADNDTFGWVLQAVDLSAYAGQTVTLQIRVETDYTINSNYFIDDVALTGASYTYIYLPLIMR
jgi:hypothetical protein